MNRYAGHRILIFHQVHDRAVGHKLRNCLSSNWSLLCSAAAQDEQSEQRREGYEVLSWHTDVSCALHDIHNSLRWGYLLTLGKQEEGLKALYVGSVALKSSSYTCVSAIGPWLLRVVEAVAISDCPQRDDLYGFYLLLGLGHAVADSLASRRVYWCHDSRRMCVALEVIEKEGDWLQGVSSALLAVFQFHVFCESRWSTVGAACRNILCAQVFGYKHFLHYMRSEGLVSEYYVNGADRLSSDCMLLAAVVSLTSHFTDSLLYLTLSDGRLARQYESMCIEMVTEFDTIEQIAVFVWNSLGTALGVKAFVLRDHVVHS
eukprot:732989-Amphidinium_carterae.1